jgi:cellulose synthase/poly-beta-1,6-N-acetylglucosamine synthase-like glycosyltransferase
MIINEGQDSILIIDTSGKSDETVLDKYNSGMFIGKTKFVQKQNSAQKTVTSFDSLKALTITKAEVENWIGIAKYGNIFLVTFGPMFFFGFKFIAAFIVSLIGLIINAFIKAKVTLGEMYKLSIYALTFSIILKVFFAVIAIEVPYFWVLYYGVPLIFLGVGLKSISETQKESIL